MALRVRLARLGLPWNRKRLSALIDSHSDSDSDSHSRHHKLFFSSPASCHSSAPNLSLAPPNILFFGSDSFSSVIFNKLFSRSDQWHQIHIVTPPVSRTGRGLKNIYRPPLLELARNFNLSHESLNRPDAPNEHRNPLRDWSLPAQFQAPATGQAHPILVTASFPYFIPSTIIRRFQPSRCLNVHPSLLPAYRGPAPIQWQIANRETVTGVTVQDLSSEGFDMGNILAQNVVPLPADATYLATESRLATVAGDMVCDVLADLEAFIAVAKAQDATLATHAPKIIPEDLRVDPSSEVEVVLARYRGMGHQCPLSIRVGSETYFVIPELGQDPPSPILPEPGMLVFDKHTKLVAIRLRRGILLVKSLKLAAAGGKGWVQPGAWWDRLMHQRRLADKRSGSTCSPENVIINYHSSGSNDARR